MKSFRHFRNAAWLYIGTLFAQAISALTILFLARQAGPAIFGSAAALLSASVILTIVFDFGLSHYTVRELSAGRITRYESNQFIATRILLCLCAAPVVFLIAIGWGFPLHLSDAFLLSLIAAFSVAGQLFGSQMRAEGKFYDLVRLQVIARLSTLLCSLAIYYFELLHFVNSFQVLLVLLVTPMLEALLLFFWRKNFYTTSVQRRNGSGLFLGLALMFKSMKNVHGANFGIYSLSAIFAAGDVMIISFAGGAAAAGNFSAVSRWTQPLGLVSTALCQAYFPHLSAQKSRNLRSLAGFLLSPAAFTLPILVIIMLFAQDIVGIALGSAYEQSADVLKILCAAILLSAFGNPINTILMAWGRERIASYAAFFAGCSQLLLQYWMTKIYGVLGASIAVVVGQLVGLTILIVIFIASFRDIDFCQRNSD